MISFNIYLMFVINIAINLNYICYSWSIGRRIQYYCYINNNLKKKKKKKKKKKINFIFKNKEIYYLVSVMAII
jgi:hypothetical protein